MNDEEIMRRNRMREFPQHIQQIAMQNPLIYQIVTAYAVGQILTREEALCQMVVQMSKDWDALQQKAYRDLMHLHSMEIFKKES
jgi:hypothetical protein